MSAPGGKARRPQGRQSPPAPRPAAPPPGAPRPAAPRSAPEVPDVGAGAALIRLSWAGTAVLAVTAVGAAAASSALDLPALISALVLFFAGTVAFVFAYFVAVGRSRHDEIAVASLYLLSGSAPRRVRRHLLGSLAAEVAIALATAAVRPFTTLAFGVLAPMFGLAVAGLWAARYGTFPPRDAPGRRRPGG